MAYTRSKHDIAITNVGTDGSGTTLVGMRLHRDSKTLIPTWQDFDGKALADQFFTGAPSQDYTDPEQEILLSQSDFRAGFGLEVADPNDPKRYFSSIGADLRFRGMAIAGQSPTTVTLPGVTAPAETDGGMETWTDVNTLTNWTETGTATFVKEDATFHGGSFSAEFTGAGAGTIYQDIAWVATYAGRRFTATAYIYTNLGNMGRIGINDGVTTTYSSYVTGDNAWHQATVTATLEPMATRLRIICDYAGGGGVAYFDDFDITGTTPGKIVCFAEFSGGLYIAQGAILAKLNNDGTAFTAIYEFPAAITDLEPFTDNTLYIAQGLSNAYYYMDALSLQTCDAVWTELVDADVTATVSATDFKEGSGSLSLAVAAGCAANDILATQVISADLTTYNFIGMWVKSSVTLSADDIRLLLDNTALCATPLKELAVPAVTAATWTYVMISLGDASTLGAVISLGLEMQVDKGAFTLQVDDIRAFKFTISTTTVKNYKFFKTVHSSSPTLWGSDSNYTIRSNTTPKADTWSGQTTVGSSYHSITELIQKSGALYIMKEDMPYYLNSTGAVQNSLAPELAALTCSTSGKNAKLWQSNIYIPAGAQALLRTDGTTNEYVNPSKWCTNLGDFVGRVQALAYDDEYLFAIVDNSTKVEVLAGRDESVDGESEFRWHPIAEITLTNCETAFASSIYQKRLWVSSDTSTESLYYIPLPTGYGSITSDANRKFLTGTYFITPWLHGNFKNTMKAFIKVTVTLGHTYDAAIYWTGAYQKLGDSSYTSIGNFDGTATNRVESLYIPVDGSSNKPKSTMMRFKFTAVTNDTTKTPIMLQYTVSAILYPTIKTIHYCQVDCREDMVLKDGTLEKNMYDTIITTLNNARNATWPVSIRDIAGDTKDVKFLPLPRTLPRYTVTRDEKGREIERVYNLLLEETPLS